MGFRGQLPEGGLGADDEEWLRRIAQEIVELAARGTGVNLATIGEKREGSGSSNRLEEPDTEPRAERVEQLADARDRHALSAQFGEHHQLEQVDRRIAAFGETASFRGLWRNRRPEQPPVIPPLQLPRRQAGQGRHFPRAVGVFQLQGSISRPTYLPPIAAASSLARAAPAKSLSVRPPSLCVV
jgi:hypothetical protein